MSIRQEIPVLARLAAPAALGNLALMLMGVVDTLVVSRLGTPALATATLGNLWIFGSAMPLAAVLMGMDTVISQAHGAGDGALCGRTLQRALVLCIPLTAAITLLWGLTERVLVAAGQDPHLAHEAHLFVRHQTWSAGAFAAWWALRQYLSGRGIVRPATWIALGANVVNGFGNWVLVFGHLGVQPHGVLGSSMSTAIARAFMAVGLAVYILVKKLHVGAWTPWSHAAFTARGLWSILRHGLPAGGQFGLEIWGFSLTGLMAGRFGETAIAAHQLALNLASLSFMVPLGISIASATRVGNLTGAGDEREARLTSRVALGMGASVMTLSALAFWLGRSLLPRLYGVPADVAVTAASILPIAATFQIFDGLQVVGCGVLRGRGDTQPAFWFNLVGYYVLGLPCAWLLAFHAGLGLPGLWWGLVLGLCVVASLLVARILRRH